MRPNNFDEMPITDYDIRLQRHPVNPYYRTRRLCSLRLQRRFGRFLCSAFSSALAQDVNAPKNQEMSVKRPVLHLKETS